MNKISTKAEAVRRLTEYYYRNGYVRRPNLERRKTDLQNYRKGYEVRLVADSLKELSAIRRLLKTVEIKPGSPFAKANQWRQPIYGRETVARFLELVGEKSQS